MTYDCPECGKPVPPLEIQVMGSTRRLPGRCKTCQPSAEEQEAAEQVRKTARDQEKRVDKWTDRFPIRTMGPDLIGASLDNFERRPGTDNPLRFARRYAEQLPNPDPPGLVLWGGTTGNGKSHLIAAIVNEARRHNMAVAWIPNTEWFRMIGTLDSERREELISMASAADLFAMDDLGAQKLTSSRAEWLFSIIDTRYRHRKPTVISTNYDLDTLKDAVTSVPDREGGVVQDGRRIVDRLVDMSLFVENKASSYREERAAKRLQVILEGMTDA